MKLEAKTRLTAAMSDKELREKIWANADSLFKVAGLRVDKSRTFVWNGGLLNLSLPGEQHSLHVSSVTLKGKTVLCKFGFDVDYCNEYYRSTDSDKLERAISFLQKISKLLKAGRGMKCSIVKYPAGYASFAQGKIAPQLTAAFSLTAFPNTKSILQRQPEEKVYVVRITGQDGNSRNIDWNPLTGSRGPWTREEATFNVQDIAHHFEYDDDFKRPTFQVVRVN